MREFAAYCDESYITDHRYRGVAVVSLLESASASVGAELSRLLQESSVREFKWSKLTTAKYRFAAIKCLKCMTAAISRSDLRADVLTWDTTDARHRIPGRDDNANLERMFFQDLRATMARRGRGAVWRVVPDEKFGVDWATLNDCLQAVGRRPVRTEAVLFAQDARREQYTVKTFLPANSEREPLIQLADLCCGLGVFSRSHFANYRSWNAATNGQGFLFEGPPAVSHAEEERFRVLKTLMSEISAAGLAVSLESTSGLRTMRPSTPLNFWWYEPQHARDRAPTRTPRRRDQGGRSR